MYLLENTPKNAEEEVLTPARVKPECIMCRDCETECPTQSFNADTGLSDPVKCIECMRCVYICPDEVIKVDERLMDAYEGFKQFWHLTEDMMKAKKSKIITEAWQTAS
jgi:MinD superfamily P-loop ATPase